ncbi:GntR family transcriptional regulator [Pseudooceanicola algae]|uniref:Uncharacterized protein n=1 Tax=Pseudooceanicola algae TaxID=1537215 RepID=A0A418SHU9_9RHOB|nr:GntR family transcriptional regulator [Pseudooceanicola algae]QPM90543.1 hypothetical protein PSAL_017820 [Pseudooceanicola algae]
MPLETATHQSILDALRMRICLTPPTESFALFESKLAQEFGLSRTPVRQVVQQLVREGLVEVKPSIGAEVVRLAEDSRQSCLALYRDFMLIAARHCDGIPLQARTRIELSGVVAVLNGAGDKTADDYVRLTTGVHMAIVEDVPDQVIRAAGTAAFWRVMRWRAHDIRTDPQAHWALFTSSMQALSIAAEGQALSTLIERIAGLTDRHIWSGNKAA